MTTSTDRLIPYPLPAPAAKLLIEVGKMALAERKKSPYRPTDEDLEYLLGDLRKRFGVTA